MWGFENLQIGGCMKLSYKNTNVELKVFILKMCYNLFGGKIC